LGVVTAPYNYHTDIPYPDSSSWLMVYTKNAAFLFPPLELPYPYSNVISDFIELDHKTYILSLCEYQSLKEKIYVTEIRLYDLKGKLLKTAKLNTENPSELMSAICFDKGKNESVLISNKGCLFKIDKDLHLNRIRQLPIEKEETISVIYDQQLDLDGNGLNEFLFRSTKGSLLILSDDLKHLKHLEINSLPSNPNISVASIPNEKPIFGITTKEGFLEYRYYKNPYAYIKFPLLLLIFIISYLVFYLLVKVQKKTAH